MEARTNPTKDDTDLDEAYAAALADWRAWDARAVEAMSCDIAVAAQRSRERLRILEKQRSPEESQRLEGRRERTARRN